MGLLGLEPRTYGLKVRCSNQLSYSPTTILQGAAEQATGLQNGRKPRWHGRKQSISAWTPDIGERIESAARGRAGGKSGVREIASKSPRFTPAW